MIGSFTIIYPPAEPKNKCKSISELGDNAMEKARNKETRSTKNTKEYNKY